MTREDLIRIIAGSCRRSKTWLNEQEARAMADTILRDMKANGLAIVRKKGEH